MVKKYAWIFIIVISLLFVGGVYLYGIKSGRDACEKEHVLKQNEVIENTTESNQRAEEIINSATIIDIRRLLCEDARDSCEERADNTSTGM